MMSENKFLYRAKTKIDFLIGGEKVIVYEMLIIKETENNYTIERCKGSDYGSRISKTDKSFCFTKDDALNYFIDKKLDEQIRYSKLIKDNELIIKQAETLLIEVSNDTNT
jgi:hypothetical protein